MEFCKDKVKKDGWKPPAPKVRERICEMFSVSPNTYSKIMKAFFDSVSSPYATGGRGGHANENTLIPQTKKAVVDIRSFVRRRRALQIRTTATQILEYCQGKGGYLDPLDWKEACCYVEGSTEMA